MEAAARHSHGQDRGRSDGATVLLELSMLSSEWESPESSCGLEGEITSRNEGYLKFPLIPLLGNIHRENNREGVFYYSLKKLTNYLVFLALNVKLTIGHHGTSQGCARLMSRESNLTRL